MFMRMTGVEPAYREAPEPKSGVSANSTTSAYDHIILSQTGRNVKRIAEISLNILLNFEFL